MRKNFGVKTYICPQPVLIVGTYNKDGKSNAMTAAWGGMYDYDAIYISMSKHLTTDNIERTKAFTVSISTVSSVCECDFVGIVSGNQMNDKFNRTGWTTTRSEFVDAPIIDQLPLCIECELISFEEGNLIGRIKNVSIDDSILDKNGNIDFNKFNPIVYDPTNHNYMSLGRIVEKTYSCGQKLK